MSHGPAMAPITKIIPFSAVDGPGSRTAVFVQGCNFFCGYCHNPETRNMCIQCGECLNVCESGALELNEQEDICWDESKCVYCDRCIDICRFSASPRVHYMSANQVLERIKHQLPFIRGYTVSGGECGLYPDFLIELMTLSKGIGAGQQPKGSPLQAKFNSISIPYARNTKKPGLTAMLDTNGNFGLDEAHKQAIRLCDGIMLDIKGWETHREITGFSIDPVLATARFAAKEGKLFELRTVCIPGLTDVAACIRGMAGQLGLYRSQVIYKLIAYRRIGVRGEYALMNEPELDWLDELAAEARECGFKDVIVVNETID